MAMLNNCETVTGGKALPNLIEQVGHRLGIGWAFMADSAQPTLKNCPAGQGGWAAVLSTKNSILPNLPNLPGYSGRLRNVLVFAPLWGENATYFQVYMKVVGRLGRLGNR